MYRFKFYYKDGSTQVSEFGLSKPEDLYVDFDGLIDWNEYYSFDELKPTTHEVLEVAMRAYKGFYKDFKRIEIINDENSEVVDYISEGNIEHKNLKRQEIIRRLEAEELYEKNRKREPIDLNYSFKIYYKDGSSDIKGSAKSVSSLVYCLDEYINDNEIYNLKNNMNSREILKLAGVLYSKNFDCYRIKIVNTKNNKVVDYIDIKENKL